MAAGAVILWSTGEDTAMKNVVLRVGSEGEYVERWEHFLRGRGLLLGKEVDEKYTGVTAEATRAFQHEYNLQADGVAGSGTMGFATRRFGFELYPSGEDSEDRDVPKPPEGVKPLGFLDRQRQLGAIYFKHQPVSGNPEAVKITNGWQREYLTQITIPQLVGVPGAPPGGRIFWNKNCVDQLQSLFHAWDKAGLTRLIKSWGGSWNPRFVRGSRTMLSNHAHASAMDLNAAWNGLGVYPPNVGDDGSVRELAELATEYGFWWGGWFSRRRDGMHFEICKVLG